MQKIINSYFLIVIVQPISLYEHLPLKGCLTFERTTNAQISLRIHVVWSQHSQLA